jgi:hypothetical protein
LSQRLNYVNATCASWTIIFGALMAEPKDNRIPIMMSDAEVQAIDDWRFTNRIPTRSEAIRRLAQRGLVFDTLREAAILGGDIIAKALRQDAMSIEDANIYFDTLKAVGVELNDVWTLEEQIREHSGKGSKKKPKPSDTEG